MYSFGGNEVSSGFEFDGSLYYDSQLLYGINKKIYSSFNTAEEIEVRGIGTHFPVQYSNLHSEKCIESLKNQGVNTVRISVYLEDYIAQASDNKLAKGYILHTDDNDDEISKIIRYCFKNGMMVLLDWHVYSYQITVVQGNYGGETCLREEHAYKFFEKYASKYGNKIMYEIANEPHSLSSTTIARFVDKCRKIILKYTDNPVMVCGHGNGGTGELWETLNQLGITDVFMSHHTYGGNPSSEYKRQYDSGIWIFNSEWGNSSASGDGGGNDTNATDLLDFYHETKIPHCFWKFTDQTMTTSVLKNRGEINSEYYVNGFDDSDLSHNGQLFFGKFKEYKIAD